MHEKDILIEQLTAERSKEHIARICQWIGSDTARLEALVSIFTGNEKRLAECSAWALGDIGARKPHLLRPWFPLLLQTIYRTDIHGSLKRNVLRTFKETDIPAEIQDDCAEICFRLLNNPQEEVAIRVFAAYTLDKICQHIPELRLELNLILEEYAPHGSPGFKSCAKKILQKRS